LREFLKTIDHVCLNDLAFFKEVNPTAENIAKSGSPVLGQIHVHSGELNTIVYSLSAY